MDRAWGYCAVSSTPQEATLEEQERWCAQTAAANGWTITRVWSAVGSGKGGTRKLLDDLLTELRTTPKTERPQRLLMVRLDRLGRGDGLDCIAAIAELRKLGCTIYTRDIGAVTITTATDAFRPILDAITAGIENEKRSDRARAGKARRRAQGLHNGNPPYGCTLVDGRAVAYEPEAVLTREIFELRAGGWGYDRLAQFAGARAIPKLLANGKTRRLRWGRSTIQRLLWCRTLRGTAIEEQLWDDANAVANPDFRARKQISWPYPLAGALRCTCGLMLSGQCSGRAGFRERYYVCRRVAEHQYYPHWRARHAEAAFQVLLGRLIADPKLLDPEAHGSDLESLRLKERNARETLEAIEARRRRIWEREHELTGAQLRERLDEIDADRDEARPIYESARAEVIAAQTVTQSVTAFVDSLRELAEQWGDASLPLKQEVARAVAAASCGLYLVPLPKTDVRRRKLGQPQSIVIYTGTEAEASFAVMQHLSENMREVDTLRNVDMAQRKMDDLRNFATWENLLAVSRRIVAC